MGMILGIHVWVIVNTSLQWQLLTLTRVLYEYDALVWIISVLPCF